jgi:hypothetical protein
VELLIDVIKTLLNPKLKFNSGFIIFIAPLRYRKKPVLPGGLRIQE